MLPCPPQRGSSGPWDQIHDSYLSCIGSQVLYHWTSLVVQLVKNLPAKRETWVRSLGWEDPLEKGKAAHSSNLAQRIRGLYSPWGHKESDTAELLSLLLIPLAPPGRASFTLCLMQKSLYLLRVKKRKLKIVLCPTMLSNVQSDLLTKCGLYSHTMNW